MNILFAAILGLVQGIAEFLPISSSGHLAVLQSFFKLEEADLLFDVLLHFATLISITIVYWKDIVEMVHEAFGFFRDLGHPKPDEGAPPPARRLALMLIVATLPLAVILPLQDYIEKLNHNTYFIGIAFLMTGLVLYLSDRMPQGRKTEKTMTLIDAVKIGLIQAVATIPGLSRSGATITAGMATGLNRAFAVKFSFLMSLPAVLGATLIKVIQAFGDGVDISRLPAYLVGMLVACVTGFFAIRVVKFLAQEGKFGKFCYYCFAAGIITLVLTITL